MTEEESRLVCHDLVNRMPDEGIVEMLQELEELYDHYSTPEPDRSGWVGVGLHVPSK